MAPSSFLEELSLSPIILERTPRRQRRMENALESLRIHSFFNAELEDSNFAKFIPLGDLKAQKSDNQFPFRISSILQSDWNTQDCTKNDGNVSLEEASVINPQESLRFLPRFPSLPDISHVNSPCKYSRRVYLLKMKRKCYE